MKYLKFSVLAAAMVGASVVANGEALLIDVYSTITKADPLSSREWGAAGVVEDLSDAAGATAHRNGQMYNITGMVYTRDGGNHFGTKAIFPGNNMLTDYFYANNETVNVSFGGFVDGEGNAQILTSSLADMAGHSFTLRPNADYKLYLFGAGDADGQDTAFTFNGVTKTTSTKIIGSSPNAGHCVTFRFSTGADLTGFTLDFSFANHSADFAAWNGAALVDVSVTEPLGFILD